MVKPFLKRKEDNLCQLRLKEKSTIWWTLFMMKHLFMKSMKMKTGIDSKRELIIGDNLWTMFILV